MIRSKEQVYEWFRQLEASNRVDFICTLLGLCLPLELRLLGACLENLARKDYLTLREFELKANDVKELRKLTDIFQKDTRSKLVMYMCLLYSRPSTNLCSSILYELLTSMDKRLRMYAPSAPLDELHEALVEDICLLLHIAIHHPAFSFHQRQEFVNQLETLTQLFCKDLQFHTTTANAEVQTDIIMRDEDRYMPCAGKSEVTCNCSRTSDRIHSLKIKSTEKNKREYVFTVQVETCHGGIYTVNKSLHDIKQLHDTLLAHFPEDAKAKKNVRQIPLLKALIREEDTEKAVQAYLSDLCLMSSQFLQSEPVQTFFLGSHLVSGKEKRLRHHLVSDSRHDSKAVVSVEDGPTSPGATPTLTYSDSEKGVHQANSCENPCFPIGTSDGREAKKHVLHSELGTCITVQCDNQISPRGVQDSTSGKVMLDTMSFLKNHRLHKYASALKDLTMQQMLQLSMDDFRAKGLVEGAVKKIAEELDKVRSRGHAISEGAVPAHGSQLADLSVPYSDSSSSELSSPSGFPRVVVPHNGNITSSLKLGINEQLSRDVANDGLSPSSRCAKPTPESPSKAGSVNLEDGLRRSNSSNDIPLQQSQAQIPIAQKESSVFKSSGSNMNKYATLPDTRSRLSTLGQSPNITIVSKAISETTISAAREAPISLFSTGSRHDVARSAESGSRDASYKSTTVTVRPVLKTQLSGGQQVPVMQQHMNGPQQGHRVRQIPGAVHAVPPQQIQTPHTVHSAIPGGPQQGGPGGSLAGGHQTSAIHMPSVVQQAAQRRGSASLPSPHSIQKLLPSWDAVSESTPTAMSLEMGEQLIAGSGTDRLKIVENHAQSLMGSRPGNGEDMSIATSRPLAGKVSSTGHPLYEMETPGFYAANGFENYSLDPDSTCITDSMYAHQMAFGNVGVPCLCQTCVPQYYIGAPPNSNIPQVNLPTSQNGIIYQSYVQGGMQPSNGLVSHSMVHLGRQNNGGHAYGMIVRDAAYPVWLPNQGYPTHRQAPIPPFAMPINQYSYRKAYCSNCGALTHTRNECHEPVDSVSNSNQFSLNLVPRSDISE